MPYSNVVNPNGNSAETGFAALGDALRKRRQLEAALQSLQGTVDQSFDPNTADPAVIQQHLADAIRNQATLGRGSEKLNPFLDVLRNRLAQASTPEAEGRRIEQRKIAADNLRLRDDTAKTEDFNRLNNLDEKFGSENMGDTDSALLSGYRRKFAPEDMRVAGLAIDAEKMRKIKKDAEDQRKLEEALNNSQGFNSDKGEGTSQNEGLSAVPVSGYEAMKRVLGSLSSTSAGQHRLSQELAKESLDVRDRATKGLDERNVLKEKGKDARQEKQLEHEMTAKQLGMGVSDSKVFANINTDIDYYDKQLSDLREKYSYDSEKQVFSEPDIEAKAKYLNGKIRTLRQEADALKASSKEFQNKVFGGGRNKNQASPPTPSKSGVIKWGKRPDGTLGPI